MAPCSGRSTSSSRQSSARRCPTRWWRAGIVVYYIGASIASTFFITAGAFAATSLHGATTKRDLSAFGGVAFMALIGLILATVVNLFPRSAAIDWILTYVGVAVFVVLTATDTQRIQAMMARADARSTPNVAILGALSLYLDFINLFLFLLRLFEQGQDE